MQARFIPKIISQTAVIDLTGAGMATGKKEKGVRNARVHYVQQGTRCALTRERLERRKLRACAGVRALFILSLSHTQPPPTHHAMSQHFRQYVADSQGRHLYTGTHGPPNC